MRKLTICGVNIADFTIVLPTLPDPCEKRAAEFLQYVIKTACGVELPLSDKITAHSIILDSSDSCDKIKFDGFRLTTDDSHLYLRGNIARAVLYAAYDFAEKYLGYRYFADDCEIIPTEGEADVPKGLDTVDNPVFAARRTTCHQHVSSASMSAHCRLNDCMPSDETYGGQSSVGGECHTFDRLCPPELYFDEHPEYYSYVIDEETGEGKRIRCSNDFTFGAQLCLTNPDVIRIVTENVLKELRANPTKKIVEVSQCDNKKYCECERCAAVDAEEESHAGTMIRFANAIAEAVEKEFPDVMVRTFAYIYTRKPPKLTKARHNVIVRYCTIEACFRHPLNDPNCSINGEVFLKELEGWGKMAHQISVWDYITNWSSFNAPNPNLISLRENARFFAENNAIHMFEECNTSNSGGVYPQLKAYLVGKLLWNPYMSDEEYKQHIAEFLRGFYGKGWREIGRYIAMEYDLTRDRDFKCFQAVDIGSAYYSNDEMDIPGIRDFARMNYIPRPYQPAYPNNPLLKLCDHLDDIFAMFDRAYDLAETDAERFHIKRSRASLEYADLFIKSRVRSALTREEQKEYEAACAKFLEDIKTYGFRINLWTSNYLGK